MYRNLLTVFLCIEILFNVFSLSMTFFISPLCRRALTGLFCLETYYFFLFYYICIQRTYYKSSLYRIPFIYLLSIEDPSQAFSLQKFPYRSYLCRRPLPGLLCIKELPDDSYRSSRYRKPLTSLLCIKDLLWGLCVKNTSYRYFVYRRALGKKDLLQVFFVQQSSYRSFVYRRPVTGLLCLEDLLQVIYVSKTSYRFFVQKTSYRSSVYRRTFTSLLVIDDLLQVSCVWKASTGLLCIEDLLHVFCIQKISYWSFVYRRFLIDLLCIGDLPQASFRFSLYRRPLTVILNI